ncbi:hypothetical protein ACUSIJ_29030 [Pseudochelatococcus sp. B33]
MYTGPITPDILNRCIVAVPPLARNADIPSGVEFAGGALRSGS